MSEQIVTAEDWQAFREDRKKNRQALAAKRLERLEKLVNTYKLKCVKLTEYCFRISKPGKPTIDFYPVSGKFSIVGSGKFETEQMQYFLTLHYVN